MTGCAEFHAGFKRTPGSFFARHGVTMGDGGRWEQAKAPAPSVQYLLSGNRLDDQFVLVAVNDRTVVGSGQVSSQGDGMVSVFTTSRPLPCLRMKFSV
jgi:hypothetical protein